MTVVSFLQSIFLISGICSHPLLFIKILEAILTVKLQEAAYANALLNRNFWSLDNTESHAGDCRKGGHTEVVIHALGLCPEDCSKSLLSVHALSWSGRVDMLIHFVFDPLRLSSHSVLVFFC